MKQIKTTQYIKTRNNGTKRINTTTAPTITILFHKPYQVLCQFSPLDDKKTLADWISIPDIYAAGRLDYDSEGLLLLTNNGKLQHAIAHPMQKQTKQYAVQVEGVPTEQQLNQLRAGVALKDGLTLPAVVSIHTNQQFFPARNPPIRYRKNILDTWLQIEIAEGRNRQVRRMTAAVGLPTLRLIRTAIGEHYLTDMQPGEIIRL